MLTKANLKQLKERDLKHTRKTLANGRVEYRFVPKSGYKGAVVIRLDPCQGQVRLTYTTAYPHCKPHGGFMFEAQCLPMYLVDHIKAILDRNLD